MRDFVGWLCLALVAAHVLSELFPLWEALLLYGGLWTGYGLLVRSKGQ